MRMQPVSRERWSRLTSTGYFLFYSQEPVETFKL
jgi:hypothetical protein